VLDEEDMMKVEAIYRPELFTVGVDDSIAEAASSMQYNEVSALPVFDKGLFVGIITERDIVRAVAEETDPQETSVGEYMTQDPASISPETSLDEAADRMLQMGVRHLPVVVGSDVIGMVSVRDLLADVGGSSALEPSR
jgi:CBS domain-containing protein